MLHRAGRSTGKVLGKTQVGFVIVPAGLSRAERDRPEHGASGEERHDHDGHQPQRSDHCEVLRIPGSGGEHLFRDDRDEH